MTPNIPGIAHGDSSNFFLLAGPCAAESRELMMQVAEQLVKVTDKLKIPYIFKASYKKANRTRLDSFTGVGDEKALQWLADVRKEFGIPVVTDIHSDLEAEMAAEYADVLQIPAFLFRQTELLVAAAKTGKFINIKKGQFAGPNAMQHAAQKVKDCGNSHIMLTERGTFFGYSDLVVDFRSIPAMQAFGSPVVMDVTHSLQQPNTSSGVTGGLPHLIGKMGNAAIAMGVDGIFMETHPEPSKALSDGANMLPLAQVEEKLTQWTRIRETILK
ncbi:MAG: 3-deoxy-8-phosphooctulonate synthase [Bacteroidia bacterium]|nr:3-deoxy-8-phosphooctulonate synthase [Bacteroidia bacterium]MCO5255014.1 3-deoxy-8-phosphooctulonate synthase [Bacteroidota bacterium]